MNTISLAPANCPQCQAVVAAGARFCTACGNPLQAMAAPMPVAGMACTTCGGDGSRLPHDKVYCPSCRWLRQLSPGYVMDVNAFMWELDAQAMSMLQSLGPVTAGARALAAKVGRPWFEAATNGIRLSERQFPDIFEIAVRAARIMGLQQMPEIYLSGQDLWDATTMGSDEQAFIVLGSVLTYFKGEELLFLLAREMGHVRAGHVMWKTVSRFLTGSTHMHRSIMGSGLLDVLNPGKMVGNAIDAPLMAWARHSEITADRAGMLAIGSDEVARKVLMSWSLKSFPLFQRINLDAWQEQEAESDERLLRLSEVTMSTMPYLARRMKMLRDFGNSEHWKAWRGYIGSMTPQPVIAPLAPAAAGAKAGSGPAASKVAAPRSAAAAPPPTDSDVYRFKCSRCATPMRMARSALAGKPVVRVKCPKPECAAELNIRPPKAQPDDRLRIKCAKCNADLGIPRSALTGKDVLKVRCPTEGCRCVMDVKRRG